jgi:hypothetical protein
LTKIESALPVSNGITPAQAKIDAVASLTMSAYAKASELRLTKEETDALQAEFADDAFQPGAAGKEHLIYIEHAHLRDRFNAVFGMGQWAIVPRNRWAEDFEYENRNGTVKGSRVYVEAMLLVRGCFVGEAVGAMEYYPSNNSQNYGDAVEGAKTAALRRCAKELGVGLQAWKKEFCEGWWERRRKNGKGSNTRQQNNSGASGRTTMPTKAKSATESAPTTGTAKPAKQAVYATKESRMRFLNFLNAAPGQDGETMFKQFCIAAGMILDTEEPSDLPLQYVPIGRRQTELFNAAISDFEAGGDAVKPFVNALEDSGAGSDKPERQPERPTPKAARGSTEPEPAAAPPDDEDEPWRRFAIPYGDQKGVRLGMLPKNKLFGWWANFKVEKEYNGRPKKSESIAKDQDFRDALDAAGLHYEFTTK